MKEISLVRVLLAQMNIRRYPNGNTSQSINDLASCLGAEEEETRRRALTASCFIVMYTVDYLREIMPGQEMHNIFCMVCKEKINVDPDTMVLNNLGRSNKWEEDTLADFFKLSWKKRRKVWQRALRGQKEWALTEAPNRAEHRQGNHRLFYVYRKESDGQRVFVRKVSNCFLSSRPDLVYEEMWR